jgi:hypothetical protein
MQRRSSHNPDVDASVRAFCAVHKAISPDTVIELTRRGLLHLETEYWRFGDQSNHGVTRSLNDLDWKHSHTSGPLWHGLIGLNDLVEHDRPQATLVIEGSKDALAAAELARRSGVLSTTGILCALGSGYRPIQAELKKLRGRRLVVIGDNDHAGSETVRLVSDALAALQIEHSIWNWCGDGHCNFGGHSICKDLYQWLTRCDGAGLTRAHIRACVRVCTCAQEVNSKFSPPPFPPPHGSTVQQFNCSTNKSTPGINADELLGIVTPYVLTRKCTGNTKSFQLARAIKLRKFTTAQIDAIHDLWFERSKALLPPGADKSKSLAKFHRQLERVRFTESGLAAAMERARKAKPPLSRPVTVTKKSSY